MPINIAVISSILHPFYGGPPRVIKMHVDSLSAHGNISVLGCYPDNKKEDVHILFPNSNIFKETWPRKWFRANGLHSFLEQNAKKYDIFHVHMLWDYPTWATWKVAKKIGKPFIITPHGSLSANWRIKAIHKRLYGYLILNDIFRDVGAMHVLNQDELEACNTFGFKGRTEIIPNGLPLIEYDLERNPSFAWKKWPNIKGKRVLLYLGRLWSQKGIDILIDAFAESQVPTEWLLVLAGPDYRGYVNSISNKIKALELQDRILLTGYLDDSIKNSLFAASECFILPSHSEGFSMAILEAIAAKLPVIITKQCHFPELVKAGGGWEIPDDKESLISILELVCNTEKIVLQSIGKKANEFGKKSYTSEKVAEALMGLYKSLI